VGQTRIFDAAGYDIHCLNKLVPVGKRKETQRVNNGWRKTIFPGAGKLRLLIELWDNALDFGSKSCF
jgi:hypothetical protein